MDDVELTLVEQINDDTEEKTEVYATLESIAQSEYVAAGKKDIKPAFKFILWSFDYNGQTEALYNDARLSVYRTYKRPDDKVELYTEERGGRQW